MKHKLITRTREEQLRRGPYRNSEKPIIVNHTYIEQLKYPEFIKECMKTKNYENMGFNNVRKMIKAKYVEYKELVKNHNSNLKIILNYDSEKPLEIIGFEY